MQKIGIESLLRSPFVTPWLARMSPDTRRAYTSDLRDFVKFSGATTVAQIGDIDTANEWARTRGHQSAKRFAAAWRSFVMAAANADEVSMQTAIVACSPLVFDECRYAPGDLEFLFKNQGQDIAIARLLVLTGIPPNSLLDLTPAHIVPGNAPKGMTLFRIHTDGVLRSWVLPDALMPSSRSPDNLQTPFFSTNRQTRYSDSTFRQLMLSLGRALHVRAPTQQLRAAFVAHAMLNGATRSQAVLGAEGFAPDQQSVATKELTAHYIKRFFNTIAAPASRHLGDHGFTS